jgi:hypothetical protein
MAASTRSASMLPVSRSTSTKTGRAPVCTTALAVAQKVIGLVITSSPGFTPATTIDRWSAAVQELTATACRQPM